MNGLGKSMKISAQEGFDCKALSCKGSARSTGETFGWHDLKALQASLQGSLAQTVDHKGRDIISKKTQIKRLGIGSATIILKV